MIYIKICEKLYPAEVYGKTVDREWDNRESKRVKLKMEVAEVMGLFSDGLAWSIVEEGIVDVFVTDENGDTVYDENGNASTKEETFRNEYDNSEYCVLGDIVVHSDGTCTVAMGKPTETEKMQAQLANAITEEELAAAYNEGVNSL